MARKTDCGRCAWSSGGPTGRHSSHEYAPHGRQELRLTSFTECAESKECHGPKHHYDECAQRVTGQIENDGKATEDCVEECTSTNAAFPPPHFLTYSKFSTLLTAQPSAPRPGSSLSSSKSSDLTDKPDPPITSHIDVQWIVACRAECTNQDTSWMTVNTRVMFRISLYFYPRGHHCNTALVSQKRSDIRHFAMSNCLCLGNSYLCASRDNT
jgi:hypothetical protein